MSAVVDVLQAYNQVCKLLGAEDGEALWCSLAQSIDDLDEAKARRNLNNARKALKHAELLARMRERAQLLWDVGGARWNCPGPKAVRLQAGNRAMQHLEKALDRRLIQGEDGAAWWPIRDEPEVHRRHPDVYKRGDLYLIPANERAQTWLKEQCR